MCDCETHQDWIVVRNTAGQWRANHHGFVCKRCGKHKVGQIFVPKDKVSLYIEKYGSISRQEHIDIQLTS